MYLKVYSHHTNSKTMLLLKICVTIIVTEDRYHHTMYHKTILIAFLVRNEISKQLKETLFDTLSEFSI